MTVRIPKYRFHKGSGQALVEIDGRRIYLGKHNSAESREQYRRLIAALMSPSQPGPNAAPGESLRTSALMLQYFRFAKTYYVKNGKLTDEIAGLRSALRRLRKLYGALPAAEFGPKAFKLVRESMIAEGLSRKYINDSMARIRRMFRWAAAEEIAPAAIYQALMSVPGLRRGRSGARETKRVRSLPEEVLDGTLHHLPEVVADMVRLQRLAGMRPVEVCILRPCDLDRSGEVWIYQPAGHKTEHMDKERHIPLGPRAQEVLLRYLARDPETYCFRPADSEKKRRAKQHEERKTPLRQGNRPGTNRARKPRRFAGPRYTTASYRRAIARACDKAFPHPTLAAARKVDLTVGQIADLREWRRNHRWAPNRLRHSFATTVRKSHGLEAAQVVLGHSGADVTQIYAERDLAKGMDVAKAIG
ncbi:MAG: site-specific integrase [Pirellulales bacterium]|nr:site-specific integrase [Pirellulales bacterium]